MERIFGGLALAVFMAVATFGPGALVGAMEWPFGAGPFTGEGQACLNANVVATELNTMSRATSPAEARSQLAKAARSIRALAKAVPVEPQHGQFTRLANSMDEALSAVEAGNQSAALEASVGVAKEARVVNRWYARACNAWTIQLPIWLNGVYAGGIPTFI